VLFKSERNNKLDQMALEVKHDTVIENADKWDAYVDASAQGNLYHSSKFLKNLEDSFGYQGVFIWAEEDGEIVGVLPLMSVPSLMSKSPRLIGLPASTCSGAIGKSAEAVQSMLDLGSKLTRDLNAKYLELRQQIQAGSTLITKDSYVTFIYNLENGSGELWDALNRKTRGSIRKAEKSGLEIEVDSGDLSTFYNLYIRRLRDLGSPPYPLSFFRKLMKEFGDSVKISLVKKGDRIIASCFSIIYKDTIHAMLAGADRRHLSLNPYSLMYWKIIESAASQGVKYFDFGRSRLGTGSYDFKKNWGFPSTQLYYQYYLGSAQKHPQLESGSILTRTFQITWRLLPLPVVAWLGPKIRKYIVA